MGRPKRSLEQEWYDIFADADVSEQIVMLRVIEALHREKRRGKIGQKEEPVEVPLLLREAQ